MVFDDFRNSSDDFRNVTAGGTGAYSISHGGLEYKYQQPEVATVSTETLSRVQFIEPIKPDPRPNYKYTEDKILDELKQYIDSTYNGHYSKNKIQMAEVLIDCGHGTGFNIGNILKYAQRYGNKGDSTEWRKDLQKIIHYAIIQLYVHDRDYPKSNS